MSFHFLFVSHRHPVTTTVAETAYCFLLLKYTEYTG